MKRPVAVSAPRSGPWLVRLGETEVGHLHGRPRRPRRSRKRFDGLTSRWTIAARVDGLEALAGLHDQRDGDSTARGSARDRAPPPGPRPRAEASRGTGRRSHRRCRGRRPGPRSGAGWWRTRPPRAGIAPGAPRRRPSRAGRGASSGRTARARRRAPRTRSPSRRCPARARACSGRRHASRPWARQVVPARLRRYRAARRSGRAMGAGNAGSSAAAGPGKTDEKLDDAGGDGRGRALAVGGPGPGARSCCACGGSRARGVGRARAGGRPALGGQRARAGAASSRRSGHAVAGERRPARPRPYDERDDGQALRRRGGAEVVPGDGGVAAEGHRRRGLPGVPHRSSPRTI